MTRELVKDGVNYYDYLMSLGDKRVEDWGLMYSPFPTILITIAYLLSESILQVNKKLWFLLQCVCMALG